MLLTTQLGQGNKPSFHTSHHAWCEQYLSMAFRVFFSLSLSFFHLTSDITHLNCTRNSIRTHQISSHTLQHRCQVGYRPATDSIPLQASFSRLWTGQANGKMEQQIIENQANMTLTSSTNTAHPNAASPSDQNSTPSTMNSRQLGLFDMPDEIRRQIYAACPPPMVDVLYAKGQDAVEIATDNYYMDTIFLVDAQREKFTCHGLWCIQKFEQWSSQLTEQHAGMLQHLFFKTPAFRARAHIPPNRNEDIRVDFGAFDTTHYKLADVIPKPLRNFSKKLEILNARVKGQRLRASDINCLVADVIGAVPFCCLTTKSHGLVCAGAVEMDEGKLLKGCCCCTCSQEFASTTGTTARSQAIHVTQRCSGGKK